MEGQHDATSDSASLEGQSVTESARPARQVSTAADLVVGDPDADIYETTAGTWALFGTTKQAVRPAVIQADDFEAAREALTDAPGEYTLLHVDPDGVVRAHRSITSFYDVYFLRGSDGRVVVTDQFRNALSRLDTADRTVPDTAVADHILYRTTPVGTYVAEVRRLGHGESLRWDPAVGTPKTRLVETLPDPEPRDIETAISTLESTLSDLVRPEDGRLLLSGGVDSTLLGTYWQSGDRTVSGAFDTPELAFEVEYARTAADMLGTDHRVLEAEEADFLGHVESTIDALGMPLQQIQTPMQDLVFRNGEADTYVNGLLADSLFGMGAAAARLVWLTRPLRHLSPVVGKLRSHREYARELLRPPTHPRGFALQSVQYQSLDLVERIVSPETVTDRQRERFRYVRDRIPSTSFPADFDTHIEVGQWVEYFCENTVDTTRQVAQARGVSMSTPYAGKAVAETALSIPTPERFLDRLSEKHVPKKLLARRLPDYRTGKPKGNGHLPEGRYFREGPLADVFEKYPMPEFVPDGLRADLPDEHPGLAWLLASYAIWRDRVLTEPVDPVPATRTVEG